MKLLLSCRNVEKSFGEKEVLKDISFNLYEHSYVGLVGNNGAGKTTLVNLICGLVEADSGAIKSSINLSKVGYLKQATSYTQQEFKNLFGDYSAEDMEEITKMSADLGINKLVKMEEIEFNKLSGGERTKLALISIWKKKPRLLILDEPTNHMDYEGIQWLIKRLKEYTGTAIIISHDHYFLDQIATEIYELDEGKLTVYSGNYTDYKQEKEHIYKSQMNKYINQKKEQGRIEQEIMQLRSWSEKGHRLAGKQGTLAENRQIGIKEYQRSKVKKRDKQVKTKINHLEKMMKDVEKPKEQEKINFADFKVDNKHGRAILEAKNIGKSFGKDKLLFKDSSFYISRGDKIALLGCNGCGKTTLLKMILGEEEVETGEIWISPSLKIGYLSQDMVDDDDSKTPLQMLESLDINQEIRSKARSQLSNIGFSSMMLQKKIGTMSLGERTKIKIAFLIFQESNLLILDEPTNHLDLRSKEEIENILEQYTGTMLLISHDRHLVEKVCSSSIHIKDQAITTQKSVSFEDEKVKKAFKKDVKKENKDNQLRMTVIELQLTRVISELGKYAIGTPNYEKLNEEYNQLIKEKLTLKKVMS